MTAGICCMLLMMVMEAGVHMAGVDLQVQNSLGILQLRDRLAQSSSFQCEGGKLEVIRNHERYEYSFSKGRIVQKPGYEILLEPVKEGHFACEAGQVWLETDKGRWQVK